MKDISARWNKLSQGKMGEVLRFGIVGVVATMLQYVIYLLCNRWLDPRVSNTIGYGVSLVFNYFASTLFTFKVKGSVSRGVGFAFSHAINYVLQTLLLSLFLHLELHRSIALLPVFAICVPVNFLLVRFFLKR